MTSTRVRTRRRHGATLLTAALLAVALAAPASGTQDGGAPVGTAPPAWAPGPTPAADGLRPTDRQGPLLPGDARLRPGSDLAAVLAAEVERTWGVRPLVLGAAAPSPTPVEPGGTLTAAGPSGYDGDGDGQEDVRTQRTASDGTLVGLRSGATGRLLWERAQPESAASVVASFPATDLNGDATVDLVELEQRQTQELYQCTAGPCTIRVAVSWQVRVVDGRTGAVVWQLASSGRDDFDGVFTAGYSRQEGRRTNALPLPVLAADADGDGLPDLAVPTTDETIRGERRTVQGPATTVIDGSFSTTSSLRATLLSGLTGRTLATPEPVLAEGTSVLRPAADLAGSPGDDLVVLTRTRRADTYTCAYALPPVGDPVEVCPDAEASDRAVDVAVLDGRTGTLLHRTVVDERDQDGTLAVEARHDLDGDDRADLLVTLTGSPAQGGTTVLLARRGLDGAARWQHAVAEQAAPARFVQRGLDGDPDVVLDSRELRYLFPARTESVRLTRDVLDADTGAVLSSQRVVMPRAKPADGSYFGDAPVVDVTGDAVTDPVLSLATADCGGEECVWTSLLQVRDGRDLDRVVLDLSGPGQSIVRGAARLTAGAPHSLLVAGPGTGARPEPPVSPLRAVAADGGVAWTVPVLTGALVLPAADRAADDVLLRDEHTDQGPVLARLRRLDGASLAGRWSVSWACTAPLACRRT